MPTRNSRKEYVPETYYHVYSRGVNKQATFCDEQDYAVFLGYLRRYLSPTSARKTNGQSVRSFSDELDLICYCLMPNHVHLLFYQRENERAIAELMQRIFTSYSMYFNKKYSRVGPLFQGRYLASRINDDAYLLHISRYIHLNSRKWRTYEYSSLRYFTDAAKADWVKPHELIDIFREQHIDYLNFLADYESRRDELDTIKFDLTNE